MLCSIEANIPLNIQMNNTQHMRPGREYEVFSGTENKETMGNVCDQSKQSNRRVLTFDWLCLPVSLSLSLSLPPLSPEMRQKCSRQLYQISALFSAV